ncbi:hypothetical protein DKX38_000205 [Salix brachista]|uniref:Uncharacterized protein n=1 Tax=Salix brachista TaxID=2182728 RepID=A0A5N5P2I4_9ROSI|nr:hypothetical protein DKX38_000205 [Salix brachista]
MSCLIKEVKSTSNSRFQANFLSVDQFSFCNQTLFEEGEAMAAALVGGSILSAFLQVLFDRMASREILDFFKERKLNDRLLKKLKIMMISVSGVLDDAEEKQVTKPAVKEWLDELKDAVYEADDLLDEIAYEAQRSEVEAGSQITTNQKDALGLREGVGEKTSLEKIPTTSLVDDIDVCGRDHDKEAILKLEDDNSSKISKKARHLSFARRIHDDGTMILKGACEARFLRTLLLFNRSHWQQGRHIGNGVMNNLFLTLKCLRALSLSLDHDVVGLPNSIGDLKHLRYLNLSATSVVRLPDSVSTLYNLQTLLLHECNDLIELPASMMKLINLCHLDITKTKLQEMPSQLGKLTKLHKLTDFFLGKQSGSSINELGKLQHLRGTLRIWNLQNVTDAQNAIKANLKGKQLLKELELTWKGDTNDSLHERLVLEQLQPHMNIECVSIVGYMGTRFPDWIGDSSFSNIVSLKLIGCKYCSSLPPLGQLVSLKDLLIKELGEIMVVGPEFYGSCTSMRKPFGSLEILTFEGMLKWHELFFYSEDDVGGAFPLLQKLYINCCPDLTKVLPNCQLPCLTALEIRKCPQLVSLLPSVPSVLIVEVEDNTREVLLEKLSSGMHSLKLGRLKSLDSLLKGCLSTTEEILVRNCDSLEIFPLDQCPKLKHVRIHGCPNLHSLSEHEVALGDVTSLCSLDIRDCPHLVSFPKGGLAAPNMTVLRLRNCSKMKSLPEYMDSLLPSLVEISLRRCPELESFPKGGLPCKLESLEVYACKKLINACSEWTLQKLHSLSHFTIGMCKEVETFPESLRLPPSLCSLKISDLQNLKSLDYRGLQHLTSLRELTIDSCPKLQSFPEEGLPATLTSLKIWALQNLKSLGHKGFQHLTALRELEIESCPMLQSMPEEPCLTTLKMKHYAWQSLNDNSGETKLTTCKWKM